ncbi:hypothetical protein I656_00452 [Geobacillus sp. WSUCF1]|nr:hypothetical protein I656_00452 [Geobacillus sp. WSUCF1]
MLFVQFLQNPHLFAKVDSPRKVDVQEKDSSIISSMG